MSNLKDEEKLGLFIIIAGLTFFFPEVMIPLFIFIGLWCYRREIIQAYQEIKNES